MKKRWIPIVLAASLVLCSGVYTYRSIAATDYDSQIKSVEEKKKTIESKKKNLQESIDDLEKDKSDVLKYVKKLDKKTNEINDSLDQLKADIKAKNKQLEAAQQKLEEAKTNETNQYDTMKKRIKYMYENGSSEYVQIMFSADNISDFLNRTEYIEKISDYDKTMLVRFKEEREKIEKKEQEIESKLKELEASKDEVKADQEAVKKLTKNKTSELEKYNSTLKTTRAQKLEYERQVAKQEAAVEALLLQKQKEIEAAQKAAAKKAASSNTKNNTSTTNNTTDDTSTTADVTDSYSTAAGEYRWPLGIKGRISSTFGSRSAPTAGASTYHKGIDIAVAAGTPILASNTGTVVTATYSSSAGNYIMIYHGKSTYTVYMHCSKLTVSSGASVIKGQVIGYVGSTGVSTGAHLHFGFSVNGAYVNPLKYVKQ